MKRRAAEPQPPAPPASSIPLPAELVRVGVVLLMDPYVVKGTVHLPPEVSRFSDAWETVLADRRTFIPITDAEIIQDGKTVITTPFIHVRKSDVRAASPVERPPSP